MKEREKEEEEEVNCVFSLSLFGVDNGPNEQLFFFSSRLYHKRERESEGFKGLAGNVNAMNTKYRKDRGGWKCVEEWKKDSKMRKEVFMYQREKIPHHVYERDGKSGYKSRHAETLLHLVLLVFFMCNTSDNEVNPPLHLTIGRQNRWTDKSNQGKGRIGATNG